MRHSISDLKLLRMTIGVRLKELAIASKISEAQLCRIENGHSGLSEEMADKIANGYEKLNFGKTSQILSAFLNN